MSWGEVLLAFMVGCLFNMVVLIWLQRRKDKSMKAEWESKMGGSYERTRKD